MTDQPDAPSAPESYQRFMSGELERALSWDEVEATPFEGAPKEVIAGIVPEVESRAESLFALSHAIHAHPELNFEEHFAAATVADLIRDQGHDIDVGTWELATSFRATVGEGKPHVAILAEYDALPDVGHGCGHNIICASAVGAFLGVAPFVGQLGGRVSLIGTPAEEGGGGKEFIARRGGFDDVDAAIMVHPGKADHTEARRIAMRQVQVTYHGLSSHAASTPFMARNPLDAVVTAYQSIAQLRQHILPEERLHGVITDGGKRPSVIASQASAWFFLRSPTIPTVDELTDRVERILKSAAEITGTRAELTWDPLPMFMPVRSNRHLASRYRAAMSDRGREVRRSGTRQGGSTDLGNISVRIPAIHPTIAITDRSVGGHSLAMAKASITAQADQAIVDAAVALARTAADVLADDALLTAMRDEFEATGGVIDVVSLDR
ncbi:MAG: M20 family metallopeptidase [Nitriliruptoraceae bacterium]